MVTKSTLGAALSLLDMPVFCDFRAGLGFGYANSDLDEKLFGSATDIHNYQGTIYFTYDPLSMVYRWRFFFWMESL